MTRMIPLEYRYHLDVRESPPEGAGWRSRLAWRLRHLADRLDYGNSLRMEVDSQPWIGAHEAARCVERGMTLSSKLIAEAARARAVENLMQDHRPHLFEKAHD